MSIVLFLLLVLPLLLFGLIAMVFLLGFRLGGDRDQAEIVRVRVEAARAARRMHDLTREAFVSMAEHVERRRDS